MSTYSASVYVKVACIAAITGYLGTELVFAWMDFSVPWLRGIIHIPASIVTWLLLVHLMGNRSIVTATIIGFLSPLVGCIVELTYFGAGLLALPYVIDLYYVFAPVGIVTSWLIFVFARETPEARVPQGFEVVMKKPPTRS